MNLPASHYLKVTFLRTDGLTQHLVLAPGESALIGRDMSCECRLDGRKVSRRHCRISLWPDGRVHLQDNESHNGTYLNGLRITESMLTGKDQLSLGEWQGSLEFVEGSAPRTRSVPGLMPAVTPTNRVSAAAPAVATAPTPTPPAPAEARRAPAPDSWASGFEGVTDPGLKSVHSTPGGVTQHVDMRSVWRWDEEAISRPGDDAIRAAPVHENPIVRRLTESHGHLDFRGLGELGALGTERTLTPGAMFNVDAVALKLVFRVTESLNLARSMDAFLTDMADSIFQAARAKAVVVLLPDPVSGELLPRIVKNRRSEESVHLSRTVIEYALQKRAAVTTEDASADERFASGESVLRFDLKAVLVVPLVREEQVFGALYLTRDLPFSNTERDVVAAVSHMIAIGLDRSRLREQIAQEERQRRALERFHAPDVVRRLLMEDKTSRSTTETADGLFLESLHATVLFCDLSGFTTFCEDQDPEAVGRLLNRYLGRMTEIVFAHGGTVDKYIGDAIMCIFGAPFMSPDDPVRAVRCALAMRRAFREMRATGQLGDASAELDVHIGVNTGKVVAGTVGSAVRMEYTALGDAVNLAARLEGFAKRGQIIIGKSTAALVAGKVRLRSLGPAALKGKSEAVEVFEVFDSATPEPAPDFEEATEAVGAAPGPRDAGERRASSQEGVPST